MIFSDVFLTPLIGTDEYILDSSIVSRILMINILDHGRRLGTQVVEHTFAADEPSSRVKNAKVRNMKDRQLLEQLENIERKAEAAMSKDFSDAETIKPQHHISKRFATELTVSEASYRSHDNRSLLHRVQMERTQIRRLRQQIAEIPTTVRIVKRNPVEESVIMKLQDDIELARHQAQAKKQQLNKIVADIKDVERLLDALDRSEAGMYDELYDGNISSSILLVKRREMDLHYQKLKGLRDALKRTATDTITESSAVYQSKALELQNYQRRLKEIKAETTKVNSTIKQQKVIARNLSQLQSDYQQKVLENRKLQSEMMLERDRQLLKRALLRNAESYKEKLHSQHTKRKLPGIRAHHHQTAPISQESSESSKSSKSSGSSVALFNPVGIEKVVTVKPKRPFVPKPEIGSDQDLFEPKKIKNVHQLRSNISMVVEVTKQSPRFQLQGGRDKSRTINIATEKSGEERASRNIQTRQVKGGQSRVYNRESTLRKE